jgi:uncharacterized protein
MAGSSLLLLIDDIASILDDVSILTKVAAKKTAGVLGDDLALNAQQVAGVHADRELPVVWAVAKGSFRNKLILVPAALLLSAFAPWVVVPLLMLGGAYLCFEGFEKIAHRFLHSPEEDSAAHREMLEAIADSNVDMAAHEREKIAGAVRTDFILSAEIIVIALGTVRDVPFAKQATVVIAIALLMTVGVYGLVAAIVKLDDLGYHLLRRSGEGRGARLSRAVGAGLLRTAPILMRTLGILGTAAMFMVGGGILLHGVPWAASALHHAEVAIAAWPAGNILSPLSGAVAGGIVGIIAGALVLGLVQLSIGVRQARHKR